MIVFLVLVAVWCAAGRYFRRGHAALPAVLIAIGVLILLGG